MPKANRVHSTQRRTPSKIQIKNGRRRNDRSRNLSTNFTACRFFQRQGSLHLGVKPTGHYAADCETGEAYAIEFVKTCDKNYGWASLMQSITSDRIRAGSKNGIVIGFMGVIGSALATVMPKAEPIVPMKAPGCHWEFHGDAIGISESLYVFGAGVAAGYAGAVCQTVKRRR